MRHLRGGQGRSADELERDATVMASIVLVGLLAWLVVAVVEWVT